MKIKFSIGIPAYKATFLKECIDSILAQTYKDFELIIVNDASPEDIDCIVETFSDNRIQYYKNKKNTGAEHVVNNWNKCLSYAKGEYFVLIGDDDKLSQNYLEEFSKLIDEYPDLGVYHCRTKIINEKSEFVTLTETRPPYESVYSAIWYRMNGRLQFISDFLYHTKMLKDNGGFYKLPLAWVSDDITAYIASTKTGIANTNVPIFMYRRNLRTISSIGDVNLKMNALKLEAKWITDFLESNKPQSEEDILLSIMIKNKLNLYFIKKKIYLMTSDLTKRKLKGLLFWLGRKATYKITNVMILYAFIESLKRKCSSKIS
jgi:glycosyltransferase involved in cell wall biosynthesis